MKRIDIAFLSILALSGIHEILFGLIGGALFLDTPTIVYWAVIICIWAWTSRKAEIIKFVIPVFSIIAIETLRMGLRIPISFINSEELWPNVFEIVSWALPFGLLSKVETK